MRLSKYFGIFILIFCVIGSSYSLEVSAHGDNSGCTSGSEEIGWTVNCIEDGGHAGKSEYDYKFDSSIDPDYKQPFRDAIYSWNNTGVVSISEDSNSNNIVSTYSDSDTDTLGYYVPYHSGGHHWVEWRIKFNKSNMDYETQVNKSITAKHEFGHTTGLEDLYKLINNDKLMYYRDSDESYYITSDDIAGAGEGTGN